MASIKFSADLDTSKFERGLEHSRMKAGEWARNIEKETKSIDNIVSKMSAGLVAYFSADVLSNFAMRIVQVRGEVQQLEMAFTTMLGSKEKADKMMAGIRELTLKTPFELSEVASGTKLLLAMGVAEGNVLDTLRQIGDIASGVGAPIERIAMTYGQIMSIGKLQAREMREFSIAGIPLYDELQKMLGKTRAEIEAMITEGAISFDMVAEGFRRMTGEGGKFANMMAKANSSVTGQLSNLKDKLYTALNEIGKSNEGIIYGAIGGLTSLVENWQKVVDVIKILVPVMGTYKLALMVTANYHDIEKALLAEKRLAYEQEIALREANAKQAESAAAREAQSVEAVRATQERQAAASAKTTAAKEAAVIATNELIAAERAYAIAAAQAGEAYAMGAATEKQVLLTKEMAAVENARINAQRAASNLGKAITAETVINEKIQADAVISAESAKLAATQAETAAKDKQIITNMAVSASEVRVAASKRLSAMAQGLLNATMLNNPYVLATVAATALGVALYKLVTYQSELDKALSKTNNEMMNETDKARNLFSQLRSLKEGTDLYKKVKKEILDQYANYIPKQLQELKNYQDQESALIEVNKRLRENIALKGKQEAQARIDEETNKVINKASGKIISKIRDDKTITPEMRGTIEAFVSNVVESAKAGLSSVTHEAINPEQVIKDLNKSQGEFDKLVKNVYSKSSENYLASGSDADNVVRNFGKIKDALIEHIELTDGIAKGFDPWIKKEQELAETTKTKTKQSTDALKERIAVLKRIETLQKELADVESGKTKFEITPEDQTPALTKAKAIRQQISDLKEQLNIKESAEKKALDDEKQRNKEANDYKYESEKRMRQNLEESRKKLSEAGLISVSDAIALVDKEYNYKKATLEKWKADIIAYNNELAGGSAENPKITDLPLAEREEFNKKMIKYEEERNNAYKEINKSSVAFVLNLEQDKKEAFLKIGESAVAQQKAKIYADYKATISQIEQDAADELKRLNEISGGIDEQGRQVEGLYMKKLPTDKEDGFNQRRLSAEKVLQSQLLNVDEEAAEKMKELIRSVYGFSISEAQKEREAIKKKYDDLREQAKKWSKDGAELESFNKEANEGEKKEMEDFNAQFALKTSQFYKKVFGDIQNYGYVTTKNLSSDLDKMLSSAREISTAGGETMYQVDYSGFDEQGKEIKRTVTLTTEEFVKFQQRLTDINNQINQDNPFEQLSEGMKSLDEAMQSGDDEKISDAVKTIGNAFEKTLGLLDDWGQSLDQIFGSGVSRAIVSMKGLYSGVMNLGTGFLNITKGNPVQGITQMLSGAGQVFSLLTKGEKAYQEARRKWIEELLKLQLDLNVALIDELRLRKEQNVFIENYMANAILAFKSLDKSQELFNKSIRFSGFDLAGKVTSDYMDTLKKILPDVQKMKGEFSSLEDYLMVLPIKVGLARDSLLGITTGHEEVFGSLLKEYPQLLDENKNLNTEVAKSILNMGEGVPDATRKALDALVTYQEKIEENKKIIDESVDSIAGFISGNLMNALKDAWSNGTDAFKAFETTVNEGLSNIVSQMVFNQVFEKSFTDLQEQMKGSMMGDQSFVDDFQKFFSQAPDLVKKWQTEMDSAQKEAEKAGFDWNKMKGSQSEKGLTGEINRMTEETGSELTGLVRRQADDMRGVRDYSKLAVNHLVSIEVNTFNTVEEIKKAVLELKSINTNTKKTFSGL